MLCTVHRRTMAVLTLDMPFANESMLEKWRFCQVPQLVQHAEEKRGRVVNYWFLPALVTSFLLLLLLGAVSFVTRPNPNNGHSVFRLDSANGKSTESWSKSTKSWPIPEHTQSLVPFVASAQSAPDNRIPQTWTHGVAKRVVIEVCSFALLQSVGMPLAKYLYSLRWWRKGGWRFLVSSSRHKLVRQAHRSLWQHRNKAPHVWFQRVLQSIKRLYKRRSRLSAASDITHVIGDDVDQEHKCNQPCVSGRADAGEHRCKIQTEVDKRTPGICGML